LTAGERFVVATVDPFNVAALGAKIPDSNTVPSVAVDDLEVFPLTQTNISDSNCYAFRPGYNSSYIAGVSGAVAWAWPAAFTGGVNRQKRASYVNSFELDRPVGHAVKIASPVAPTTATGWVHIALAFESFTSSTTWPWPTTTAGLSGYQWYKRVTLASLTQTPLTIVNKFVDDTAFRYLDTTSSDIPSTLTGGLPLEFAVPKSWGTILVAFEGVGSLNPLTVEHQLLVEAIPKSTAALSGSPAAPPDTNLSQAASQMSAAGDFTTSGDSGSGSRGAGGAAGVSGRLGTALANTGARLAGVVTAVGNAAEARLRDQLEAVGQVLIEEVPGAMVEMAGGLVGDIIQYQAGQAGIPGVNNARRLNTF